MCIGATPEELEEIKLLEMEAKMKKEEQERAELERQEAEEAELRRKRHNEWVRITCTIYLYIYTFIFQDKLHKTVYANDLPVVIVCLYERHLEAVHFSLSVFQLFGTICYLN